MQFVQKNLLFPAGKKTATLFRLFFCYLLLRAGCEFKYCVTVWLLSSAIKNKFWSHVIKSFRECRAPVLVNACAVSIGEHAESNWILCQGTIGLRGAVCCSGWVADNSLNQSWGRIVTQVEDWSQLWGLSQSHIVSLQWVGSWPERKLKMHHIKLPH